MIIKGNLIFTATSFFCFLTQVNKILFLTFVGSYFLLMLWFLLCQLSDLTQKKCVPSYIMSNWLNLPQVGYKHGATSINNQ